MEAVDLKLAMSVFGMIFLAELGDKTQVATLLLAADRPAQRFAVFVGAAAALVLASAIGVIAGGWVTHYLPMKTLHFVCGLMFIGIGLWTLSKGLPF